MAPSTSLEWWRPVRPQPQRWQELDANAEAGSPVAFAALAFFTFVLLIQPQVLWPALAPMRPALIAAAIAVMATLAGSRSRWGVRPAREMTILGVLVAWSLVMVPMSMWPGGSVDTFVNSYSKVLIVFWLITVVVATVKQLRTLMWLLAVITIPLSLTGVRHFASGIQMSTGDRIVGYGQGLAANPNDLALTLDIILPLVIALAMTERRLVLKLVAAGIAMVDIAAILLTFSRGGFLTLVVILAMSLWWFVRRGTPGLAAAVVLVGVMAMPLMPAQLGSRLATITDVNSDPTGSAQERWRDTVAAVQFLSAHPIVGAGLGMDALALNDVRGTTWRMVHNAYLNYAVDLGLPGVLLFLTLLISCLHRAARAERLADGSEDGFMLAAGARAVRIALWGFAVGAFFYPVAYQFYFYYLAGLALAIWSMAEGRVNVFAREHAVQGRFAISSQHV